MDMKNQINMFINLGFVLLHPTNDDEMTKKKKVYIWKLIYIRKIQIVQNTAQLSSKGKFNQPPLFLIHWNFGNNQGEYTLNQLSKWGLNPWIRYLREKFLLKTNLISKEKKHVKLLK